MHELSLMEEVRRIAERRAAAEGASRIHRIGLRIGSLGGVDPEALAFAFAVVMAGGPANEARLDLEVVATRCLCPHCREAFEPADVIHACPRCGSLSSRILQGKELELTALEIS